MTTLFVTRHPGAREWARHQGIAVDTVIDHLDPETVQPGDTVIGTLPVNLAARVCERGARYLHLSLEIPPGRRGGEFSVEEMEAFGAKFEAYAVRRVTTEIGG